MVSLQGAHIRHFSKSSLLDISNEGIELVPLWPWFVFLAGAMCCLVFSSVSHLFACHSRRLNLFFWRLDYAGISVMIVCSFFAPIYYAFYCQPYFSFFYLTSITIIGVLATITLLSPSLASPRFRTFRASLFLSMGFSGLIPAVHAAVILWDHPQVLIALGYEVLMGILYAIGAWFYVSRIPEKWKPGLFDLAGHSHQIFHVFVVGGALAHSAAILIILHWRQGVPTCS
ncbi:Heptahelical transmembrane protein 2 [Bienertia sinuspersici]